MKCLLKHRMMRGREAERTLRYTVQRRVNNTHSSTVTLQSGGERGQEGKWIEDHCQNPVSSFSYQRETSKDFHRIIL